MSARLNQLGGRRDRFNCYGYFKHYPTATVLGTESLGVVHPSRGPFLTLADHVPDSQVLFCGRPASSGRHRRGFRSSALSPAAVV